MMNQRKFYTSYAKNSFYDPIKKLDFVKSKVSNAMESAVKLSIPLLVDIGFGNNWNESH